MLSTTGIQYSFCMIFSIPLHALFSVASPKSLLSITLGAEYLTALVVSVHRNNKTLPPLLSAATSLYLCIGDGEKTRSPALLFCHHTIKE